MSPLISFAEGHESALIVPLRSKAVEQTTLSSPLRMAIRNIAQEGPVFAMGALM